VNVRIKGITTLIFNQFKTFVPYSAIVDHV